MWLDLFIIYTQFSNSYLNRKKIFCFRCRCLSRSAYWSQRNFNTNCEMMWRPKIFLAESKWFRVSVSWAMSQKLKPKSYHWQGIKSFVRQNRSTPVANRRWFSIYVCVCVFGFFFCLLSVFRPIPSTPSRFVALYAMWYFDSRPANWRIFFRRVHSFFLFSHTECCWCGVVCCSRRWYFWLSPSLYIHFKFWPFLCDTQLFGY